MTVVWIVLGLAIVVALVGTPQWPRVWRTADGATRLLWLVAALWNLAAIVGAVEVLDAGYPTGFRWIAALVATVWLLIAVSWHPAHALHHRLRTRREDPPCSP